MDSKLPDAQAAHEMTLTAMLPALAGANLIYGLGMLESGLTWDYAQLVMQNEFVKMIHKAVEGITVNDDTIAMDVIQSVGPGGEFISHEHTFLHMRELSQGQLIDRRSRDGWKALGGKSIVEKAYEKAQDILENYKPEPLPEKVQSVLKSIVEEAEEEIKVRKAEAKKKPS